jgi:hypothetical protein
LKICNLGQNQKPLGYSSRLIDEGLFSPAVARLDGAIRLAANAAFLA